MELNSKAVLDSLYEDRHKYLLRVQEWLQHCLEKEGSNDLSKTEWENLASDAIVTAGQQLSKLNASIQYFYEADKYNEYPKFVTWVD